MSQHNNDLNSDALNSDAPITTPLTSDDAHALELIELLFFAYRSFTSDPDELLSQYKFGRAHHRVIHFVNRKPGMTVAELLTLLNITKQSLARVQRDLVEKNYITQMKGEEDKRQRHLYPTAKGREFALALAIPQSRRIISALDHATDQEYEIVLKFLKEMVDPQFHSQLTSLPHYGPRGSGRS